MARRELGAAALRVAQAVAAVLPERCVVGCSGGADSLALALGAHWAGGKRGSEMRVVVVDHGLQPGSDEVAARVVDTLTERGLTAEAVRVAVEPSDGGLEAAARDARLAALTSYEVPVLLGHTLDDQAETVLLGLLRGSGTRSLAGMAAASPHGEASLLRPLLGLRRAETEAACREWGVEPWADPMNDDPRFARVAVRRQLAALEASLGRDMALALGRTAHLARADADLLDELSAAAVETGDVLAVAEVAELPDALRWRVLHRWLGRFWPEVEYRHVLAVDALATRWRGQGPVAVPGGGIARIEGVLQFQSRQV